MFSVDLYINKSVCFCTGMTQEKNDCKLIRHLYRHMHIGISSIIKSFLSRRNVFIFSVFIFIISRLSGIRFWHRSPPPHTCWDVGLVARVSMSLISPPFLIKSNTL